MTDISVTGSNLKPVLFRSELYLGIINRRNCMKPKWVTLCYSAACMMVHKTCIVYLIMLINNISIIIIILIYQFDGLILSYNYMLCISTTITPYAIF